MGFYNLFEFAAGCILKRVLINPVDLLGCFAEHFPVDQVVKLHFGLANLLIKILVEHGLALYHDHIVDAASLK